MKITETQLRTALSILSGRIDLDRDFWYEDVKKLYGKDCPELHPGKLSCQYKAETILFELLKCKL